MSTADQIRERLRVDTPYYAEHCLKIVDKGAEVIPLMARPSQLKLEAALEEQRAQGLPMRAIVLKSRQTGISTWVQGKIIQRATQRKNRRALVVAQDNETAGVLFDIGAGMYDDLPDEPELKPKLTSRRNSEGGVKLLKWGDRGKGLNSMLRIDTAKEVQAGRGKTISDLHCSEVAFWPDPSKALSLLNAVPDELDTLVVMESTANGHNFFKARWDRAVRGEGAYVAVFIGWPEDPDCTARFPSEEARAKFIETIGTGPWGKDEPRLIEKLGCTPEQLLWRRNTIVDKCEGKLELFKQEYPASAEEAFIGSGRHVFSIEFISKVLDTASEIELLPPEKGGPQQGLLLPAGVRTRKLMDGEIEVPTGALWVPRAATGFDARKDFWTIWKHPVNAERAAKLTEETGEKVPVGQYIVAVDPAAGEDNTAGDSDYHGIQVIDHRSGEQMAEYRSRIDPDLLAQQALLIGLYYLEAWIAVEITGGYGLSINRKLWNTYGYRFVYERTDPESKKQKAQDRYGWSTDRRTKPAIEDGAKELLREGSHGIKSKLLALELTTYVKFDNGKHGADTDAFDDLLMPWMIGQYLRAMLLVRRERKPGEQHSSLVRSIPR